EGVRVVGEWEQAHPDDTLPQYFVTALDLAPEEHVKVQAVIQRWVDSSISKTCNLPNSYTVEETRRIYELLYKLGCKGGTIYRDGSRDVQVLNLKEEDKAVSERSREAAPADTVPTHNSQATATSGVNVGDIASQDSSTELVRANGGLQPKVRPRPYKRRGHTVSKATPSGTGHITMNKDEQEQ